MPPPVRAAVCGRGAASPGRPGSWRWSAPARWACRSPRSSRRTAGTSSPSTSTRRSWPRSTRAARTSTRSPASPSSSPTAHGDGMLRATTDGAAAAREADVVVLIVPVMLDADSRPDYRHMDAATDSIAPGIHAGSLVIYETTLPVGDTRGRYAPRLEAASGLRAEVDGDDGLPRGLLAGAAVQRRRAPESRHVPQARRRPRAGCRATAPRRSTTACSMPRSWRCRRPRRPSSRSSPTRPTAT